MKAATHARGEVKEVVLAWGDFRDNQLPALNKVLEAAHHARIDLTKAPDDMPEEGDED
jgi:hypothetical protein